MEGLRDGERTVGDLAADLPVSRPAVSQHLGVLKAAGLVLDRPQGTRRYYRLDPIGLVRLQGRLDALWGLDEVAGAPTPSAPPRAKTATPTPARKPAKAAAVPAAQAPAPKARPEAPTETAGKRGGKKRKKKRDRK